MGFSRPEYWSGLPFPSPRDLPDPRIEPGSPAFQADALLSEPPCLDQLLTKYNLLLNTIQNAFFWGGSGGAMLGLPCFTQAFIVVRGLLTAVDSLVAEHGL